MTFFRPEATAVGVGQALVRFALGRFAHRDLTADRLGLTLLLHPGPLEAGASVEPPAGFAHGGDRPFYPCSVVKAFYLVAAQAQLEAGILAAHEDLDRAMRDMIRVSSNMATNYVIDLVTGTTGDTLLDPAAMAAWSERRHGVNRYFAGFGWPELAPINLCQKLMDDERYGREKAFVGPDGANHNRLTSNATARLFHAIMTGQVISTERSRITAGLLQRPTDADFIAREPAGQILGYLGEGLPEGARLWSKAGLTGWTGDPQASYRRHDAAYVELPDGPAFTLAVFSEGKSISTDESFLPSVARHAAALVAAADHAGSLDTSA